MKRIALLMMVMVCLSMTAFAADDSAKTSVFGGFLVGHAPGVTPVGWIGSVAYNAHPAVAVVGDFSGLYKNGGKTYSYMGGPRYNVRQDKVNYFVEAFFGGSHFNGGGGNAFQMAYGGGVDIKAGDKMMVRVIEFDWTPARSNGAWFKKSTRYGFGVVFPLGK
jgi:opacity protein-like surface antigen